MRVGVIALLCERARPRVGLCAARTRQRRPTTARRTTIAGTSRATADPAAETDRAGGLGGGRPRACVSCEVAAGLDSPLHVAFAPGRAGPSSYVVERPGRIRVLEGGRLLLRARSSTSGTRSTAGGEQGLLSVAFHPGLRARTGSSTSNYTDTGRRHRRRGIPGRGRQLARAGARASLSSTSRTRTTTAASSPSAPTASSTSAWATAASGGDPENRGPEPRRAAGQAPAHRRRPAGGRVGDRGATACATPGASPSTGRRATSGSATSARASWEEIDYLAAGRRALVNFGWDVFEGTQVVRGQGAEPGGPAGRADRSSTPTQGCSVTGGYVYRGGDVPAARGRYFYGDYCSGTVWSLVVRGGQGNGRASATPFEVPGLSLVRRGRPRRALPRVPRGGQLYRLASR